MTLVFGLTDEALKVRRQGIGGSNAYTVVHGTPEERFALFREMIGETKPKKIMSDWAYALRMVTETLQLDWHEHLNPEQLVTRRGEVVVSDEFPWMRCTLDGYIAHLGVPINCKHISRWQKEAREWCIEHYTPQATHEAVVLKDADYALLSLLHGDKEPELIRIDVDPFYRVHLIEREREFMQAVTDRVPPADCAHLDVPKVAVTVKRKRDIDLNGGQWSSDGQTLIPEADWPNWSLEMISAMGEFEGTYAAHAKHMIARKTISSLIPDDVGSVVRGNVAVKVDGRGCTITLKGEGK